jgi:predicted SAM-dependent methyltransferase
MIKKNIQKIANCFGYTISKTQQSKDFDLDLYQKLFPRESLENKCFYNIGAGSFSHPYWTNVDLKSDWYKHAQKSKFINFDLQSLKQLPIENDSAEIIYSSHTVEHITDKANQNLFNEAYRILKPEGVFRFSTPNVDLIYRAYKENDRHCYFWIDRYSTAKEMKRVKITRPMESVSIAQIFLSYIASQTSILHASDTRKITDKELSNLFSQYKPEKVFDIITSLCDLKIQSENLGNHINWWNETKARTMLKKAGFENKKIFLSGYGQSFSAILRNTDFFDTSHPKTSLFMEVKK